uniref:CCHC-type domain-containing protein n=1 Tax=Chrysemys picta bellii TaxID=8478 RepID=A0A8C3FGM4_CHRPI
MDDFLNAFETACELHRVNPADKLRVLTPLLDPKAVALYRQLEEAEKGDYELFKKALLRKFGLTPKMYRKRFRSQNKTPEISYLQLAVRMEEYASKWADGAQTKENLVKLLVLEQLYERCPSDLRLWLVDRKPENPRHAGRLADEFVKSRSGDNREESQRNSPTTTQRESHHGTSPWKNTEKPHQSGTSGIRTIRPTQGDPWDMGCYHCGQKGHIRAQCPRLRDRLSRPNPQRVDWVETQPGERQHSQGRGAGGVPPAKEGGELQASSSRGLDAPDSGFLVYTVGAGLSLRREYLVPLEVDGRKVNGYWNTGAKVTLARPEVVAPDQVVPNTYLTLTGVGETPVKVPVARVHLKWGAKEGPKDVGVHPYLPTEVLMGGDLKNWPSNPQRALVVTRSQSRQGALRPGLGGGVPCLRRRTLTWWGGNAQGHGSGRLQLQTQRAKKSRWPSLSQLLSSRPSYREIPPCGK